MRGRRVAHTPPHRRREPSGARAQAAPRARPAARLLLLDRVLQARDGTGPDQDDFARAGSGFGLVLDHPAAQGTRSRARSQWYAACCRRPAACGCSSATRRSRAHGSAWWSIRWRGCGACWATPGSSASAQSRRGRRRACAGRGGACRIATRSTGIGCRMKHSASAPIQRVVRVLPAGGCGHGGDAVEVGGAPGAARAALRVGDLRRRRLDARAHAPGRDAHPARDRRSPVRRT